MSQSTVFDITERKLSLEALQESESLFRSTLENAPIGMARVSLDGRFLQVNRALCRLVGYEREELLQMTFQELTVPEDLKEDLDNIDRLNRGEIQYYQMGKRYYRKDRQIVWIQLTVSLLRDSTGKPRYFISQIEDITERKRAEEALRRSEYELKEAQRVAQIGNWDWDLSTHQQIWSEELYRIFGRDPTQPLPRTQAPLELFTPESRVRLVTHVERAIKTGASYSIDLQIVTQDGSRKWVAGRGEAKRNDQGVIVGLRGTLQDITERKRLEEELSRSNTDLEQYAYIVSHDLREPLRMIQSYVELIKKRYQGKLDSNADRYIGYIVEGASRMAALINDLLNYARAGRAVMTRENVDLNRLLQSIVRSLAKSIQESHAQITIDPLPTISIDPGQVAQIFQNLISNAIKFQREGEVPRIHISAKESQGKYNDIVFSIEDNGIGIQSEYSDRIFMIFQRLHGRDKYPGTGIGLSICKRIIERHGGHIWFSSIPNVGTTFYFTLPPERAVQSLREQERVA
jgi:PAS domain S-box-containing protein